MKECIDIADSLTALINSAPAGTFNTDFVAQRTVLPEFELSELKELKVSVVPAAVEITNLTRSSRQYDFTVDIGIQKKVTTEHDSQVAELSVLISELIEFITANRLPDLPWATFKQVKNDPVYSPSHLREKRVFISVITVSYRALK